MYSVFTLQFQPTNTNKNIIFNKYSYIQFFLNYQVQKSLKFIALIKNSYANLKIGFKDISANLLSESIIF